MQDFCSTPERVADFSKLERLVLTGRTDGVASFGGPLRSSRGVA